MKLYVKNSTLEKLQEGCQLILVDDLKNSKMVDSIKEGEVMDIVDQDDRFYGKILIGRQNKGLGWIFTQQENDRWNESFVSHKLSQAIEQRDFLFNSKETNTFRLFNGEGDGIGGVTVDYYDGYLQINWYSRGLYGYRVWFINFLQQFDFCKGIYETKRFSINDQENAIEQTWGEPAPQPIIVKENNINYAIYLGEDWMTGLFLDQREVRKFINNQVMGMNLLNLFSYTGAFSIAAAVGGAIKTVSVDVANRSLDRTIENFELNNCDVNQHEIRVMDVFDYIQYAKTHNIKFNFVVCDPPSFARTKKYTFSAEKDYKDLAKDLIQLTEPGGMLVLSTNHSGYSKDKFLADTLQSMQSIDAEVQLIQSFALPEDYPTSTDLTSNYLKVLVFYRVR